MPRKGLYGIDYNMDLYSNFTYAIDTQHGDQFEQLDQRRVYGGYVTWSMPVGPERFPGTLRAGLETRYDDIRAVGLYLTEARERHDTVREDEVNQAMTGLWLSWRARWNDWLRSEIGVRTDRFDFDVHSDLPVNSGNGHDQIVSPKAALTLGPWRDTEFFIATGQGFHANDARGATISIDPTDGLTPAERVTPLVKARGSEIGLRTALLPASQLSLAL